MDDARDAFGTIKMAPPDPILGISQAFAADKSPNKINLGVGAYRDNNGKPYVFNVVRKAEEAVIADKSYNKEYQGIDGNQKFIKATQRVIFGEHAALKEGRVNTNKLLFTQILCFY